MVIQFTIPESSNVRLYGFQKTICPILTMPDVVNDGETDGGPSQVNTGRTSSSCISEPLSLITQPRMFRPNNVF
jgi:hypothetical protein